MKGYITVGYMAYLSILGLSDYERHGQLTHILKFPNKTVFVTYFNAENENSVDCITFTRSQSPHTNLPLSGGEVELFMVQND